MDIEIVWLLIGGLALFAAGGLWLALRSHKDPKKKTPQATARSAAKHQPAALSAEEQAEMLNGARELSRQRPAEAAKTIRSWLNED